MWKCGERLCPSLSPHCTARQCANHLSRLNLKQGGYKAIFCRDTIAQFILKSVDTTMTSGTLQLAYSTSYVFNSNSPLPLYELNSLSLKQMPST